MGYRWFDHQHIEPLFPFGFGLSYTHFTYADASAAAAAGDGFDISVTIQNTGAMAGDEVAQVYIDKPEDSPAGVQFADDILGGFERVHLAAGESRRVVIHVPLRQFQYWSTKKHQWSTPGGTRTYWVGGSSRDRRLKGQFDVKTSEEGPRNRPNGLHGPDTLPHAGS